jgi:hypothetical protein
MDVDPPLRIAIAFIVLPLAGALGYALLRIVNVLVDALIARIECSTRVYKKWRE